MNDIVLLQVLEGVEELDGESPNQTERQPVEVVQLQEVVEVDTHELEGDAQVLPEYHIVLHVDNVHSIVGVVVSQVL